MIFINSSQLSRVVILALDQLHRFPLLSMTARLRNNNDWQISNCSNLFLRLAGCQRTNTRTSSRVDFNEIVRDHFLPWKKSG